MRRARVALVAAAVVLAAAACGDGDGEDRLSREEWVRAADAICTDYDGRLEQLPDPNTLDELADVAERAHPIARAGVRRLRALRPPAELANDVDEWLDRNDANVRTIERLGDAARAGDETRVQEIASAGADNEAAADALARELGLRACARRD